MIFLTIWNFLFFYSLTYHQLWCSPPCLAECICWIIILCWNHSNRFQSASPWNGMVILSVPNRFFSISRKVLIFFGCCFLCQIASFLADPVLSGFSTGSAITIATSQLKEMLGLKIPRMSAFSTWIYVIRHLRDIHWGCFAISKLDSGPMIHWCCCCSIQREWSYSWVDVTSCFRNSSSLDHKIRKFSLVQTVSDSWVIDCPRNFHFNRILDGHRWGTVLHKSDWRYPYGSTSASFDNLQSVVDNPATATSPMVHCSLLGHPYFYRQNDCSTGGLYGKAVLSTLEELGQ